MFDKNLSHEEIIARLKSNRHVVGIPLAALVADLLVRVQSGFDLSIILPVEAVIFALAGITLFFVARRHRQHSLKVYRIEMWLGLVFLLGAIRAALWQAGMDIRDANLIDLVIGLPGAAGVYFWTRRQSETEVGTGRNPEE